MVFIHLETPKPVKWIYRFYVTQFKTNADNLMSLKNG